MKTRARPRLRLLAAASAVAVLAGVSAPTVAGAGVEPGPSTFSATPTTLNFGDVPANTSAKAAVTLDVPAGLKMSEQGVVGGGGAFTQDEQLFDACWNKPGPLTCPIGWIFTPGSTGAHQATGTISGCPVAGGECVNVDIELEGTGVAQAEPGPSTFSATPTTLNFGDVPANTSAKAAVTLNVPAGLQMGEVGVIGDNVFDVDDQLFDACYQKPGPLTCPIGWIFTPDGAGPHEATGDIVGCPVGGGDCIPVLIKLEGTGVAGAEPGPGSPTPGTGGPPLVLSPAPARLAPVPASAVSAGPRFTG